ncbi:hypothetical protein [Streptacidiphilus jiangxiensis]|uniref:Integrase core domain-containing protein n=1 Tax=Streptacidiphilus jiangxiensis TaxID=235985 RepID=A0A1H7X7E6_STRJI|nr:hypothetical protein [Streptacidiphilus jiangxiensis]SEM29613.1 hypothetical protein SAMN05414137_12312 [Streptacidiphilus jiangxiensis]
MDFIETVTLTAQCQYILAVIHHASRRVRILGTTAHPTHAWVTQVLRNLLMDLEDAGQPSTFRFLIRDRDAKYPAMMDEILQTVCIAPVLTGVQVPRKNAVMERWVRTLRAGPRPDPRLERGPPASCAVGLRAPPGSSHTRSSA